VALGSLFVASHLSQGCGGGILNRILTGIYVIEAEAEFTLRVSTSWYRDHSRTRDQILILKFAVLSLWGALSGERSGLSLIRHRQL
jgi:hypothetical protein